MDKAAKVYVAGHTGLVGSAIVRKLEAEGYCNIVTRGSAELDLRDQLAVSEFFRQEKPEYVFLAAAKVGGIVANSSYPAEFIYDNLMIQTNVIHHAYLNEVTRLLFLGSTCIYPKLAPQPLKEEYLLTGPLEPTNEPYAIAKIAGIKMCQAYNRQYGSRFVAAMPTNLYGPNDNFDLETSHVLPALLRKFHEAKANGVSKVVIWGTGSPLREFLHVDDLADACLHLMNMSEEAFSALLTDPVMPGLINVGSGDEISISDLGLMIRDIVGYDSELIFDSSKPDGMPRKLCDTSRLRALCWEHKILLEEGVSQLYRWFLSKEYSK